MITRELLRSLRNDLPMSFAIRQLGRDAPYSKCAEGRFRFICLNCQELQAAVNPRNNLAHCFRCGKNINNIDLLLASGYTFQQAVRILQEWLQLYNREKPASKKVSIQAEPPDKTRNAPELIASVLREAFEKDAGNCT